VTASSNPTVAVGRLAEGWKGEGEGRGGVTRQPSIGLKREKEKTRGMGGKTTTV